MVVGRRAWPAPRRGPGDRAQRRSSLGSLEDALILNTAALTGVSIDAGSRRVRVGAATTWEQVDFTLSELGLGSTARLVAEGRGRRLLARRRNRLALPQARHAGELRDGDRARDGRGSLRPRRRGARARTSSGRLRGGNGNFGVVTALEFEVYPVPELYAGALFFPLERSAEVLHAWTELLPSLPEELTPWANVLSFPAAAGAAEGDPRTLLRGGRWRRSSAARPTEPSCCGRSARLARMDTLAAQPPASLAELAMDPADPLPYRTTHSLLEKLPATLIEEAAAIARTGSALTMLAVAPPGRCPRPPRGRPPARARRCRVRSRLFGLAASSLTRPSTRPCARNLRRSRPRRPRTGRATTRTSSRRSRTRARSSTLRRWERLRRVKAALQPADLFKGNRFRPAGSAQLTIAWPIAPHRGGGGAGGSERVDPPFEVASLAGEDLGLAEGVCQ